jgi:hypothetical protein
MTVVRQLVAVVESSISGCDGASSCLEQRLIPQQPKDYRKITELPVLYVARRLIRPREQPRARSACRYKTQVERSLSIKVRAIFPAFTALNGIADEAA